MRREQGFTLLEVLIALTIFAIAAGGFLTASSQSLRQMQAMESKTVAEWVAENRLSEIRAARNWLDVGVNSERVALSGRDWDVRVSVTQTGNADMRQVAVDVFAAPAGEAAPLITLTGFVGRN